MNEVKWITDRLGVAPASEYDRERGFTHHIVTRDGEDGNANCYSVPVTVEDITALGTFYGCVPWGTLPVPLSALEDAAAGYPSRRR